MYLEIDFGSDTPIYEQIRREIIRAIGDRTLGPGAKLYSVRDMAEQIGVNLHTVNKAYKLLEEDGLIKMDRRYGTLVRETFPDLSNEEGESIKNDLSFLLTFAKIRGGKKDDFVDLIEKIWEEKDD